MPLHTSKESVYSAHDVEVSGANDIFWALCEK